MITIKKQLCMLFIPFVNCYILYAFFKNSKYYDAGWRWKQFLAQVCGVLLTLPFVFLEDSINNLLGNAYNEYELILYSAFALNTFACLLLCQKWLGIDWE